MPASIALCMIVRDEAHQLPRCLSSLAGAVDAIHITDTGSQDNTIGIAKAAGAEVRYFSWCDDFAAARNFSIANVKEDWLLILDADDEFPPGEAARIRSWLTDAESLALTVLYQTSQGYTPSPTRRILRNHSGITFRGVIHESVRSSLPGDGVHHTRHTDVKLIHHGFTGDDTIRKNPRNLPLLQRAWGDTGTSSTDACYRYIIGAELGRTLIQLGKITEGEQILLDTLSNRPPSEEASVCALECLGTLVWHYLATGRGNEAVTLCATLAPYFQTLAAYRLYRGLAEFNAQHFAEALADFKAFESLWQRGECISSIPVCYTNLALWDLQGQCNLHLGKPNEAATLFRHCLAKDGGNKEYQIKLHLALKMTTS